MLLLDELEEENTALDGLVDRAEALGMFPEIAGEVRDLIGDNGASARDLEQVIGRDASLMAHILRTANAPAYGSRRVVTSLRHALVVLGFRDAAQISMAFAMMARDCTHPMAKVIVQHAEQTAIAAQNLARVTRSMEPAEAFVAGMLHDFGALVLIETFGTDYARVIGREGEAWPAQRAAERQVAGTDHCELAEACLMRWRFSRSTSLAIRNHHRPLAHAGFSDRPSFNGDALIAVADWLADARKDGGPHEALCKGIVVHPFNGALEIGEDGAEQAVDGIATDSAG